MKRTASLLSNFRAKLVLLVMLPVLPALLLALHQNQRHKRTERARIEDRLVGVSRLIAANESALIKNARQQLSTLAQFPFLVLATDFAFAKVHLENLLKLSPDYINFGLIESNGTIFAASLMTSNGPPNVADRSYFQRALTRGRFAVGDYQVGRLSGEESLNFGYPVRGSNGEVVRVLFASVRIGLLTQAASQIPLPDGATVTILDRTGTVIARLPDSDKWVGRALGDHPMVQNVIRTGEGAIEAEGLDGTSRLYAVSSITDGFAPCLFVAVGVPLEILFAEARESFLYSVVLLGIISVVGLLAASYIAERTLINPVSALVETADRLADGNYDSKADVNTGTEEFRELADAFNRMAERLKKREAELVRAQEEIVGMNQVLEERVRERTAELAEANQELEAFSYSVSHDLRAPLRHLDGFSQLLMAHQKDRLDEKGQRYLTIVSDSARKMGTLIDDLLSFSRMARKEMMNDRVDMNRLVQDVIASMKTSIGAREVEWVLQDLPEVHGDAAMLRQVWANLISNALKYSRLKEMTRIEIGCESGPNERVFYVKDNGVGFDMAFHHKLFGVFQRLHSESEFEGTGIGLANVRRIVSRHGGRTWAESVLGEGATFYFSLPLQPKR